MFKRTKVVGMAASLMAIGGLLGACNNEEPKTETVTVTQGETGSSEQPLNLDAEFVQDGNNVNITWDTNLTLSSENYGGDHVEGEGHVHIYVDGERVAGLKALEPYVVEGLSEGTHVIKVELQKNNHETYGVSKEQEVTIPNSTASDLTLEAEIVQSGNSPTINWNTNLLLSAEHYGGEHVEGEGHVHVFVDGERVAGLKAVEPYVLEGLSEGKHTVEIALQTNDHRPLNVSKTFEVEYEEETGVKVHAEHDGTHN